MSENGLNCGKNNNLYSDQEHTFESPTDNPMASSGEVLNCNQCSSAPPFQSTKIADTNNDVVTFLLLFPRR